MDGAFFFLLNSLSCMESSTVSSSTTTTSSSVVTSTPVREQSLEDRYGIPENFLEIEVVDPQLQQENSNKKFIDYKIFTRVKHKSRNTHTLPSKFLNEFFFIKRPIYPALNSKSLQSEGDTRTLSGSRTFSSVKTQGLHFRSLKQVFFSKS